MGLKRFFFLQKHESMALFKYSAVYWPMRLLRYFWRIINTSKSINKFSLLTCGCTQISFPASTGPPHLCHCVYLVSFMTADWPSCSFLGRTNANKWLSGTRSPEATKIRKCNKQQVSVVSTHAIRSTLDLNFIFYKKS